MVTSSIILGFKNENKMIFGIKGTNSLLNNNLFKDSFWALLGNAFGKGLTVISGIIVARLLGKDLYGEFGLLRSTLLIIAVFSTMGLGYSGTVFVSERKEKEPGTLKRLSRVIQTITILFSSIIALFTFLFSRQLSVFLEDVALNTPLRYLSVIIIFNALTTSQIGILAGLKAFKGTAIINVISGVVNFLLTCFLTYIKGFNGTLIALMISQIINCVLNSLLLSRSLKSFADLRIDYSRVISSILGFSIPIALQEMIVSLAHWATTIFLLKLTNYGEIGLYSAAGQWTAIIQFFPIALRNVTLSHMSAEESASSKSGILNRMIRLNLLVTVIPTVVIIVFHNLIDSLYGPSFIHVGIVISIACIGASINSVFSVYASDFMSRKHNWILFCINLFREFVKFPLIYILVVIMCIKGSYSAYLSFVITELVAVLLCYWLEHRIVADS